MSDNEIPFPLTRTLTLRDLVLFNLVSVISITSLAAAASTGVSALALLIIGAVFFFIPLGLAVNKLSASFPEEGGIYSWTKRYLGKSHGFICGWCYWINNVLYFPSLLLSIAVISSYSIKGSTTSLSYVLPFTLVALWLATVVNIIGLKRGKWLHNLGGIGTYVPFIILLVLSVYMLFNQPAANSFALKEWKPHWNNIASLNLWATIPFAYSGIELSSTLGNEIRNPNRNLPRSIIIAAIMIGLFYIIGSAGLLYCVPRQNIDVIGGFFQAITVAVHKLNSHFWWIASFAAISATLGRLGSLGAWISGSARVAMVVGIDNYFPKAFARVHPKWHTPHIAILVQSVLATIFLLMAVLGKGTTVETTFFTLLDMSIVLYFIPYTYLFICFILHCLTDTKQRKSLMKIVLAISGLCGLLITLFALFVAMIPPLGTNQLQFELKVIGGCILLLLLGGVFYWRGTNKLIDQPIK